MRVSGGERFGSGIVWSAAGGLVLTALHVVEEMEQIWISADGVEAVRARIADADPALDLALLRTEEPLPHSGSIARPIAPPQAGERVTLVGWAGRRADAGEILDPGRRFAGARYLEIGARAEPGASGGAVLDARGAVVGVVDLVLLDRGTTLAIPIDVALARFPEGAPAGAGLPSALTAERAAPSRARPPP